MKAIRPLSSTITTTTSTFSQSICPCHTPSYPCRTFSNTTKSSLRATEPTASNQDANHASQPTQLSDSEYHELSDEYMNTLTLALEEMAEDSSKGMEVEYSAGVLTVNHPRGTYVLNKQPPNHQIWLSSPISGPKRYDWVSSSHGQGQNVKEGTEEGGGRWVYLRDGTGLSDLLGREIGVEISREEESEVTTGKEGPGGSGVGERRKLDGD